MQTSSPKTIRQVGDLLKSPKEGADLAAGHESSQVSRFYDNRSVLITGGSGFIGKVLIEKLLRSCPGVQRIFVLIRPKWGKDHNERLEGILKQPLFDQLRASGVDPSQRVVAVEGDVVHPNLGLSDQSLLRIMNEVSVIYHSAATVKFDEPLKQSVAINITGTKNMVELCRKIPRLKALVHVSTAYANCDLDTIDEHIYPVNMDPERLVAMADWLDQDTLQELKLKLLSKKPNTYTYTKALAEWLLIKSARDLPVVICRPSIVVASWREPVAGWIDNINGPTGVILGCGKGLIRSMYADSSCVADLVPVDTVINLVITLGWFASVYQKHKGEIADCFSDSLIGSSGSCSSSGDHSLDIYNETDNCTSFDYPLRDNSARTTMDECMIEALNKGRLLMNTGESGMDLTSRTSFEFGVRQTMDQSTGWCGRSSSNNNNNNNDATLKRDTDNLNELMKESTMMMEGEVRGNRLGYQRTLNLVDESQMAEQDRAAFEYKLKQFRHNAQATLANKGLGEELADIPVFHCTSGSQNPITWGRIALLITTILTIYPSSQVYRYPTGAFTFSKLLDNFYRITLHYIPAYLVDIITRLFGGKPILVRVFRKFDQAAQVLKAFTTKEWHFDSKNSITLATELMSEVDRRQFDFDLKPLDWEKFLTGYVIGVRQFMLKEPISNLSEARSKLKLVYYRNLSLQVLFLALAIYCLYIPLSLA